MERPNISALGSHGGSNMFNITIYNPLSPPRIRDGLEDRLALQKNAWDEKIRIFRRVLYASATAVRMLLMPISNHGGDSFLRKTFH